MPSRVQTRQHATVVSRCQQASCSWAIQRVQLFDLFKYMRNKAFEICSESHHQYSRGWRGPRRFHFTAHGRDIIRLGQRLLAGFNVVGVSWRISWRQRRLSVALPKFPAFSWRGTWKRRGGGVTGVIKRYTNKTKHKANQSKNNQSQLNWSKIPSETNTKLGQLVWKEATNILMMKGKAWNSMHQSSGRSQ